jgi:hypothetical protein
VRFNSLEIKCDGANTNKTTHETRDATQRIDYRRSNCDANNTTQRATQRNATRSEVIEMGVTETLYARLDSIDDELTVLMLERIGLQTRIIARTDVEKERRRELDFLSTKPARLHSIFRALLRASADV